MALLGQPGLHEADRTRPVRRALAQETAPSPGVDTIVGIGLPLPRATTGDTGPSTALTELAKGADVLVTEITEVDDVIEVMKKNGAWQAKTPPEQAGWIRHMTEEHVTPAQVGQMAVAAGVKTVVMTHFSPTINPKDDYQRYVDGAKKFYSGQILLAKDLMRF